MIELLLSVLLSYNVSQVLPATPKLAVEKLAEHGINAQIRKEGGFSFFAPGFVFDSGSSDVSQSTLDDIELIVDILEYNGIDDDIVSFQGHTDSQGDPELNLMLGELRAENVKQAFIEAGLSPKRTLVQSFGDTQPISDDDAVNRRVEIVVIDEDFL